jgi:predicted ABC-type ATPase
VALGGHNVPEDDIRRRYERSLANAPKALRIAELGFVFDNTESQPRQMLELRNGLVIWKRSTGIPAWVADIERALSA